MKISQNNGRKCVTGINFQKSHIEIIFCFDEHENALNFVKLLSTVTTLTSKNGKDSMPHAVNIIFNDIRPHIIPGSVEGIFQLLNVLLVNSSTGFILNVSYGFKS